MIFVDSHTLTTSRPPDGFRAMAIGVYRLPSESLIRPLTVELGTPIRKAKMELLAVVSAPKEVVVVGLLIEPDAFTD